ncbi:MAG: hypothetical protein RIQ81_1459 [Pseudomonadota bacterium]|jgi:hypothetical protein
MKNSLAMMMAGSASAALCLLGCGGPVNDERVVSNISLTASELGGTYSGAFSASSGTPQLMSISSGSLSGSSIMIPPGALSINLSVSVSSSTSLATSAQAGDLGISGVTLSAAGPAVNFAPSSDVELSQPMLLSIPLLSSGLWLDDSSENMAVVYKAISIKDGATEILSGLIPRSELVIAGNAVKFKTLKFGAFQVVKTSVKVEAAISKPSSDKIGSIPGIELVGTWEDCRLQSSGGSFWFEKETFAIKSDGTFEHEMLRSTPSANSPSNCATPSYPATLDIRQNITGKFGAGAVLDSVTVPSGASSKARELDFSISSLNLTPLNSSISYQLNNGIGGDQPACGVYWSEGTSVNLQDSTCAYEVLNPNSDKGHMAVGDQYLTIYAIGKTTAGVRMLYMGEEEDQDTRPSTFGSEPRAIPEVK